jgi:hypothetical protein
METKEEKLHKELSYYFTYASYIKVIYPEAHTKATEWADIDKMVRYEI